MPKPMELQQVPEGKLPKGVGPAKEYSAEFAKKIQEGQVGESDIQGWLRSQKLPVTPKNPEMPIKAVPVTLEILAHIQSIGDHPSGPSEMLNQKLDPTQFVGMLYSVILAYQFMKIKGEFAKIKVPDGEKLDTQWTNVVATFLKTYASAGLKGLSEEDLNTYAKILSSNAENLNTVTRIVNSAVKNQEVSSTKMTASFVPDSRLLIDTGSVFTSIPRHWPIINPCAQPLAQGSYTKHFYQAFTWQVSMPYPCWDTCKTSWWPHVPYPCNLHTCYATFTVGGAALSLDLSIGYKVNCCGVMVWGLAYGQACGTVLGATVCATCSASIVGVAGISTTHVGGGCSYGLGVTAALECKVAGITVFYASVPFGWTVTGPCPPIKC